MRRLTPEKGYLEVSRQEYEELIEKLQRRAEPRGFKKYVVPPEVNNQGCRQSEEANARDYGARTQPGSGCCRNPGLKDDSRKHGVLRIEQKNPQSKRFTIKVQSLDSLWKRAVMANEFPIYLVMSPDTRWNCLAVIDHNDLLAITTKFNRAQTFSIKRSMSMDLDHADDILSAVLPPSYILLDTPKREYAMMLRTTFDQYWGFRCSQT